MKKKLSFIFLFLSLSTFMYAQDIITLKTGDEIKVIVQEVGTDAVKYKKFDNQQGPAYTIKKADIFMIKYKNGDKDVFAAETPKAEEAKPQPTIEKGIWINGKQSYLNDKPITRKELSNKLKTDPQAYAYLKKGNTLGVTGGVISLAGIVGLTAVVISGLNNEDAKGNPVYNKPLGLICAAGIVGGIVVLYVGDAQGKKAIDVYNSNLQSKKKTSYELKAGITDSGISLALNF